MFVIVAPLQKQPRATRNESRSIELEKLIHNNDKRPLDMTFDKEGGTWRAIGNHHGKFNNLTSQYTKDGVLPCYPSWEKVHALLKQHIVNLQWVCNYFKLKKNYCLT